MITSTEKKYWYQSVEADPTAVSVKVELGAEAQTIRGFGGCFSELGAVALKDVPEEEKTAVNEEFFSADKCGFTFCRIPIGASDFALSWYSCNETPGDYEMKNFSIERDKQYIIPWIKEAQEYCPDLNFMASPWSPPTWMKFPAVYNFGTLIQTPENLKAYALYFKKFIESYKAEGVSIGQLHVQNEPVSTQKFPSCVWKGEEFRNFISNYLVDELDGCTDIFLGTLNGPETDDRALWTRFYQYAQTVLLDKKCREHVKGMSYQWAGKFAVQQAHDCYPDLELIQSESECGDGKNSWQYAMYIYEMMHHYFRNGVSSYVYWNMVLAEGGASSWGWNQNSLVSVVDGHVVYNPEFYLMKHFSHFVKPGAKYLETKGEWSCNVTAFKNPDGSVIMIVMNPMEENVNIEINHKSYTMPPRSFNTIVVEE